MNNNKSDKPDRISTKDLFAELSPPARRKFLDLMLATDFSTFLMKVFETVSPGDEFRPNWHIDAMTYAAECVIDGKIKRLITTVPPRHLKSIIYSVALPAFLLGQDPTKRIICVSYSNDLANKHAIDFRAVVGSEWYGRIFPGTIVSREGHPIQHHDDRPRVPLRDLARRNCDWFRRPSDRARRSAKTGRGASEAHRNSAAQWFDNTLLARLDSKSEGAIVLVMQRLHQDDLAGRLLEKGGWEQLKIAAIAEQDEQIATGPRRIHRRKAGTVIDPRRETLEDLERMRKNMTELFFSAQYQQEPIPLAGNLIKAEWFKEYDTAPSATSYNDTLVISIDTAMKGSPSSDYSVATVWQSCGEHAYLLDVWRERLDYPDLKRAVIQLHHKYRGAVLLIEDKGSGTSLIQDLRSEKISVIGINPEKDKLTRVAKISALFEAGSVFFPRLAPWLNSLKAELLGFPNARYDDQVDSITQALSWLLERRQHQITFVPPIIVITRRTSIFDIPSSF